MVEEVVLAWDVVEMQAAGPESPAIGPDLVAAAGSRTAIYDAADGRVLVLDDLKMVGHFDARVDDLAVAAGGDLVLLQGRTLRLVTTDGTERDAMELPALVPTGAALQVDGARLAGVDPFGNLHPAATIAGGALVAWDGPALLKAPHAVRSNAPAGTLTVDGRSVDVGKALKLGGRVLDSGSTAWLVVDRIVGDHPIAVERSALAGATTWTVPADRLYAPFRDLAADGSGRLVAMVPETDGLHVLRVTP